MRTYKIKKARIPYTWGEICELAFVLGMLAAFAYLIAGCIWHLPGYCNGTSYACPEGQTCNLARERCEHSTDGGSQ
jgi:hypothetical protein